MLTIKNFTKVYPNGTVGAKDLNLTVKPGDICAFIGPNGSGKTTTIRCIVGTLPFTQGEIMVNGCSVKTQPLATKLVMGVIR